MIKTLYRKVLYWLVKKELKRLSKIETMSIQDVIRWHDEIAIQTLESKKEFSDNLINVMLNTNRIIEALKEDCLTLELIDRLIEEEASSITIFSDNVDFTPHYNNKIIVNNIWTDYKDKAFVGDSLKECLIKADEGIPF